MPLLHRALGSIALALSGAATTAATLAVSVTDNEGQPVPDAAVLLRYAVTPVRQPQPAPVVVVDQEKLRFMPYLSIVAPGTTVLFTNRDKFDHHVVGSAVQPDGTALRKFETRLPPDPTKPFGVQLTEPGRYALSCHLHSRMRGYVFVSDTPWFGKTDENGQLVLNDLPDGAVEVQAWHPEQFLDQPVQRLQLGAAPAAIRAALNFRPRARRGPP